MRLLEVIAYQFGAAQLVERWLLFHELSRDGAKIGRDGLLKLAVVTGIEVDQCSTVGVNRAA